MIIKRPHIPDGGKTDGDTVRSHLTPDPTPSVWAGQAKPIDRWLHHDPSESMSPLRYSPLPVLPSQRRAWFVRWIDIFLSGGLSIDGAWTATEIQKNPIIKTDRRRRYISEILKSFITLVSARGGQSRISSSKVNSVRNFFPFFNHFSWKQTYTPWLVRVRSLDEGVLNRDLQHMTQFFWEWRRNIHYYKN